jgi:hypothetical protein
VVVLDQRHIIQAQALQHLAGKAAEPAQRQVSVASHRPPVRPQRQRGHDAAMVARQVGDYWRPYRPIHRDAVQEDKHRAISATVLILDRSSRQLYLAHLRHLRTSGPAR